MRVATLLTTLALVALAPVDAQAVDAASPTAWVADGPVQTIVPDSSGRLYVGGDFQSWGPRLGHGVRLSIDSDTPAVGFPDINGTVFASVADGSGGEFIGGNFTSIGGVARSRLAHIRADGSLDPDWNPGASGTVRALALSGADLFVGGDFTGAAAIAGAARQRLAKLSAATGAVDATWGAQAGGVSGSVATLGVSAGTLYVGGSFGSVSNASTHSSARLAKVSTSGPGDVDEAWVPAPDGAVKSLVVAGSDVYVAGLFGSIGGQTRQGLAKLTSGATGTADATWNPAPNTSANTLLLSGSDLYAGGDFQSIGGQSRHGLAKLATTGTGAADATWDPSVGGEVTSLALLGSQVLAGGSFDTVNGDKVRHDLAAFSTSGAGTVTSWTPQPNGPPRTITASGTHVFAGGDFTSAGPLLVPTGGLVRLNADGTLDKSWSPLVIGSVNAIALDGANVYAGGDFNQVDAQTQYSLAKIPIGGDGSPDATWKPNAPAVVRALALSGSDLYVGGEFTTANPIGGQARNHLAKLTTSGSGNADATWNPDVQFGNVYALALSGSDLFVAGSFSQVSGQPRSGAAKVSTTGAGAADADWDPAFTGQVNTLAVSGSAVFAGGTFPGVDGMFRPRLAKVAASGTGALDAWNPGANAEVKTLAVSGDQLYAGGAFTQVGGFPTDFPSTVRNHLARFSLATAAVDTTFDLAPSTNGGGVNAIALAPNTILVGGDFDSVGNLSTSYFALFDLQPPTLDVTVPSEGARYRQGQVVNAAFACADPSGALGLSCVGTVAAGTPIDTGSPGAKTFTATATDQGGNAVSKTVNYSVDGSPPAITITQPAEGASYVIGSKVVAAYSCVDPDGDTDVVSCAGGVAAGVPIDTSSAGTRTFTVTSADAVGNTETRSVRYTVSNPTVRPIISALKIAPAAFRAAPKGATTSAKAKKLPVGGKVSYRLSLAATVTFKVTRKSGRKTTTVGTFKLKGKRGVNKFIFRGRLKKKTLKPGQYRLIAQATGATGLRSVTVARSFRIAKG